MIAEKRSIKLENLDAYLDWLGEDSINVEALKNLSNYSFFTNFSKTKYRLPTIIEIEREAKYLKVDVKQNLKFKLDTENRITNKEKNDINFNAFVFSMDLWRLFDIPIEEAAKITPMKGYFRTKKDTGDPSKLLVEYMEGKNGKNWKKMYSRH